MINRLNKFIIKNKHVLLRMGLFLSIIYILIFIRISTIDFDENFTLSLVKHNWNQIIHLTSLDVHPPLYYFILKAVLSIFTFWTSSLLIKIFVARLLSIISAIISWIFLCKILKILHIKNNVTISWISFILSPTLLGYNFLFQQMTNIRMYSLVGLFIIIEFYYLLKFRISLKNRYLIISILFASLASYTQYYSAIIAGLLLLLYFIKYFLERNIKISMKLLFSGILIIIFYIPWISIFLYQINNSNTYWIQNNYLMKQIFVYLACVIIFLYPILIYYKHINNDIFKEQIFLIIMILITMFIFVMIYGYIKHPIFMFRYMYPILLIYEFIGMNTMINLIKYNNYSKFDFCYYTFIFIALIFNAGVSFVYQIPNYNIPSIKAVNNYINWNKNTHNKIYINKFNAPNNQKYNIPNSINLVYSYNKNRFFVYDDFLKNNYNFNNIGYKEVYNNIGKQIKTYKSY